MSVLDDGTTSTARVCGRARRAVWHAVLAIDVGIRARADLHLIDRHGITAAAGHGRMIIETSRDALVLEGTLGKSIALAEGVGAGESREVITAIRAERARAQRTPVVATLLRRGALVVRVRRTSVSFSVDRPSL